MDFLEHSYSIDLSKFNLLPRMQEVGTKNISIFGPPKSGKTSLVLFFLQKQKPNSFLYIDLEDLRADDSLKNIQQFIDNNKIEIVAIDNFEPTFILPNAKQIITISQKNPSLEQFESIFCQPLGFEEFLIFDKKHQNITASFNYFLKFGNLPQTVFENENSKIKHLQDNIKLMTKDKNETIFLQKIFSSCAQAKSVYQLYVALKKEIKISKDRFYAFFDELLARNIIMQVSKMNQPKINAKIMLHNHAYLDAVTTKKNFNNSFENMIFLELYRLTKEIFYVDGANFYLPEYATLILCSPFFNQMSLGKNTSKLLESIEIYDIQKVKIITVASSQKFFIGNIEATVEPFYEWALEDEL